MTIDRELHAALDIDPSPDFLARVRQRVASEPEPRGWRAWWVVPVAAAAIGALVVVVWQTPVPDPPEAEHLLASRVPAALVVVPRLSGHPPSPARPGVASRRVDAAPAVLIDANESRALRRLVFGSPLNIEEPYTGPSNSAIEIAPISIEPLPIGSEGARQ